MQRLALLLLLCLTLPCAADDADVERLVDGLFSQDAQVRADARGKLLAAGEGTLAAVLERIEARQPSAQAQAGQLRIYDARDLQTDAKWWKLALTRIQKAAAGAEQFRVQPENGPLVVVASEDVHRRIAAELAALRRAHGRLVALDVRIVRLAKPAADLPEELAADAVEAFLRQHEAQVTSAPRLTQRNGQEASIEVTENVSFVEDFDVEVGQGTFIADPLIGVMQVGVTLNLRPVLARDGAVRVAARAWQTTMEKPIPTLALPSPVGGGNELTIQDPETRSVGVARLVTCRAGKLAVVDLGNGSVVLVAAAEVALGDE